MRERTSRPPTCDRKNSCTSMMAPKQRSAASLLTPPAPAWRSAVLLRVDADAVNSAHLAVQGRAHQRRHIRIGAKHRREDAVGALLRHQHVVQHQIVHAGVEETLNGVLR